MTRSSLRPAANPIARASVVLVLLSQTLFAAAGASDPLPKVFKAEWCAYRTAGFQLFTDLPHRQALRTINGLARFRQMFVRLFPKASDGASLPLTMLVFRRERDFAALTGTSRYAGVTLPSMHEYRLLAASKQLGASTDNAWHEYTHYLLRNRTGQYYPLWYEEGLASYLGAADLKRNRVTLGRLPYRQMLGVPTDPLISFNTMIEATSVLDLNGAELLSFYSKAWLLAHFLRHGHQSGFPDQRAALAGYLNGPTRNFVTAFGYPPDDLDTLLADYLRKRPLPQETLRLPETRRLAPERACLAPAERDYQLAYSILPLNPRLSTRVLEQPDPDAKHLTALAQATWSDRESAAALVDRALALEPEHPDANVHFAHLLVRGCEFSSHTECIGNWARAVAIYRGVLNRHPSRLDAAYGLGVAFLHTGRAAEAMSYLRLAYRKMPSDVRINFYLGEGYRIAGDRRAAAHLQNARNWARNSLWRERADFSLQRLRFEQD